MPIKNHAQRVQTLKELPSLFTRIYPLDFYWLLALIPLPVQGQQ